MPIINTDVKKLLYLVKNFLFKSKLGSQIIILVVYFIGIDMSK
jgi:hypothetical protein